MAFGGFSRGQDGRPMAEINMIPLIDVMLVLLVIFIITAPLLSHAVKINLPQASSTPDVSAPDHVQISIDAEGQVYWNDEAVDEPAWIQRMQVSAAREPQPEVRIRADGELAYKHVVALMADAAQAGLTRIGFVTDPDMQGIETNSARP